MSSYLSFMKVIMVLIWDLWKLSWFWFVLIDLRHDCFIITGIPSYSWTNYSYNFWTYQSYLFCLWSDRWEILFAILPVPNYHYYPVLHTKLFSSLITYMHAVFWCLNFASLFIHNSICYWFLIVSVFIYLKDIDSRVF